MMSQDGRIPLEDEFTDVLAKAQNGLGMSDDELSQNAGVPPPELAAIKAGVKDEDTLRRLAGPLKLHPDSLIELAYGRLKPEAPRVEGLAQFNTPYEDMRVNAYLVWDKHTKKAAAFDSGASAKEMLALIDEHDLDLERVFLTHTHPDHVAALDELVEATGRPPVHVHGSERTSGMMTIEDGATLDIGELTIEARLTSGHSPGGMTYVISGLSSPVAVVGDALFSASAGGAGLNWLSALERVASRILSLPGETVICPGHGPMSTIGWEKQHNPLFPRFK